MLKTVTQSLFQRVIVLFAASILLFILAQTGSPVYAEPTAASFYVALNGNDANPGTLSAPWRTISHAASSSAVRPGDTVYIRGGTYNEYVQQRISGSPGKLIVYRSYPGETAVLTGSGTFRWHILEHSHVRLEGLTFRNFSEGGVQIRTRNAGITGIEIVNCTFENQQPAPGSNGSKTIHVTTTNSTYPLNNILVSGNRLINVNSGDHPAIQVEGRARQVRLLNNVITGASSIGIGIAGRVQFGQPNEVIVRGNVISGHGSPDKHSAGIYLDGAGEHILVEENIVFQGIQGIKVGLEQVAAALETRYVIVRRNVVFNNNEINLKLGVGTSSSNCDEWGKLAQSVTVHNTLFSSEGQPTNFHFGCGESLRWKNNILSHLTADPAFQYRFDNATAEPTTWKLDYNLFHNGGGAKSYHWDGTQYATMSAYQTATGQDGRSLAANPLFVNENQRDFRLRLNSPARDGGGPLTWTTSAGSGQVVPVVEAWYFSDGLGMQPGDRVRVGSAVATVVDVDYAANTVTVDRSLSWTANTAVGYDYAGSAPDIGAFEYVPRVQLTAVPGDRTITLLWEVTDNLPPTATWRIEYDGPSGNPASPINNIAPGESHLTISGLRNYSFYTVTITAVAVPEPLNATVIIMPTDIFVYMPAIQRNN
jgi:hypothetical protein